MVTTIFPTLWPEVSALCASRNWLKWNFRMGGTEILPPSIQLLSCFKYFSPVSISSEKKLLGYKCNECNYQIPMDSTAIQQLSVKSRFLADGQLLSKEQVESQDCLWVQGQKHWILSDASVVKPSWRWDAAERRVTLRVRREFFPSVKMRCAGQIDRHANPI